MILITGATGLIGSRILLELATLNKKVRALKRSNASLEEVKRLFEREGQKALWSHIEWVEGDITDVTTLENVFEGVKEVYHIAGYVSFDDRKSKTLYEVNVKGTANMVNFAIANGVERFLYMSTIAVMDAVHNETINEKSEFLDKKVHSKYACSKFEGEMEVWRGSQEGLDVVIVNPGVVLGSGFWNQSSGTLFKRLLKGYYTSGGSAFVSVNDVAKISVRLLDEACFNERFIVVSENVLYEDIVKTVCDVKGVKTKRISNGKLKFLYTISSCVKALGFTDFMSKTTYHMLTTYNHYDHSKVKNQLNYSFEGVHEALVSTLENYPCD